MTRKYVKFTEEEDNLILMAINDSPLNIMIALEKLAPRLNRKYQDLHKRYYKRLKKNPEKYAASCGSKVGFSHNVKNLRRNANNELPEIQLNEFDYIVNNLTYLTKEQKKIILTTLINGLI